MMGSGYSNDAYIRSILMRCASSALRAKGTMSTAELLTGPVGGFCLCSRTRPQMVAPMTLSVKDDSLLLWTSLCRRLESYPRENSYPRDDHLQSSHRGPAGGYGSGVSKYIAFRRKDYFRKLTSRSSKNMCIPSTILVKRSIVYASQRSRLFVPTSIESLRTDP